MQAVKRADGHVLKFIRRNGGKARFPDLVKMLVETGEWDAQEADDAISDMWANRGLIKTLPMRAGEQAVFVLVMGPSGEL